MRNEEVLLTVKEQRNNPLEIIKRKANWIGQILRRNSLLQKVIDGKIKGGMEVTGRRGRRCRKLLDDLKERRGYSHLKEEALDRTMCRGYRPRIKCYEQHELGLYRLICSPAPITTHPLLFDSRFSLCNNDTRMCT